MEIRLYYQIIRRGWWIILLTALTSLTVALVISYLATPQYKAVAEFIITPSLIQTTGPDVILQGLNAIDNQTVTSTYAEVMNSNRIYNDASAFLQLNPQDLKNYTYKAVVLPSTSVLQLTVTGPNPQTAAKFANALGLETINFTRNLNKVITIDFLDMAVPPTQPSSPQPVQNSALALALGLFVGVFLAILSEQLRVSLEAFRQRLHLDNVTGVYNSKYFPRLLEDELSNNAQEVLCVGIVELNGLRDLYDTFPIAGLQRVFRNVTEILRKELRGNDVIGRWTDISFIIMLPNTSGVAANGIFERIYQALSEPIDLGQFGTSMNLNVFIGGAEFAKSMTAQDLLDKANSALEQARRDHEHRVKVWELKNPFWADDKVIEA